MNDDEMVRLLLSAMDCHLPTQSPLITFLQLRVASEGFIVQHCAWAADHALSTLKVGERRLYLEKGFDKGKRADLALVPIEPGNNPIIFEFKTAWPGWPGAAEAIHKDLLKWKDKERAFSIVFLFCFDESPRWCPYGVIKGGSLDAVENAISAKVGCNLFWQGTRFPLIAEGTKGTGQLAAWQLSHGETGC